MSDDDDDGLTPVDTPEAKKRTGPLARAPAKPPRPADRRLGCAVPAVVPDVDVSALRDATEKERPTWVHDRPPGLVSDSLRPEGEFTAERVAHARALEVNTRDGLQVARQARKEAWEAKLEAKEAKLASLELKASNAKDHAVMTETLIAMQKQLPDAARAGRIWAFATAAVAAIGTSIVGYYGYQLKVLEARSASQQAAPAVQLPLPIPRPSSSK